MPLDDLYHYFERYDATVFNVATCQGQEPTEEHVAAFEQTVGFRLPDEFRAFTKSPLGGLYIEVKEELWPRPGLYAVGEFWGFLYGLKVFGMASRSIPPWLDIRKRYAALAESGNGDLVPFLQLVGDGDVFCFDRDGRITAWRHDEPDAREPDDVQSFSDLLMRELHQLEGRKTRKLAMGNNR